MLIVCSGLKLGTDCDEEDAKFLAQDNINDNNQQSKKKYIYLTIPAILLVGLSIYFYI